MALNLGGNEEQFDNEMNNGFSNAEVGRFKEYGNYTHRVLDGPKRMDSCWYPSWREDSETGAIKASWNKLVLPKRSKGKTLTDKLAAIDRKVQHEEGIDSQYLNSVFDRQTRYIYIVISRDLTKDSAKPWIGFWEYPTSVSNKVRNLNCKESSRNKGKLNYGPYWTYDIDIEKINTDSGGDKRFNTSYNADVVAETLQYAGKIPMEVVTNLDFQWDKLAKIQQEVFTPEEVEAIESFMKDNELDSYVKPMTNEEILDNLTNIAPIKWDEDNFKFRDKLLEAASEYKNSTIKALAKPNKQLEEKADTQEQVEEDYEELSDEEMADEDSFLDDDGEDW